MFDCDGVLVDSEPASDRAWVKTLGLHGISVGTGELDGFVGRTDAELADHFAPIAGVGAEVLAADARSAFVTDVHGTGLLAFEDALVLRAGLHCPVAVGSNSARWRLDAVLRAAGMADLIPCSVASDEVSEPKPAPFVYQEACRLLGVDPARTLVVEDSPTGIQAARSTGCPVVAIDRGFFPKESLSAADEIVETLDPARWARSGL